MIQKSDLQGLSRPLIPYDWYFFLLNCVIMALVINQKKAISVFEAEEVTVWVHALLAPVEVPFPVALTDDIFYEAEFFVTIAARHKVSN
jgi:hypothetical protein